MYGFWEPVIEPLLKSLKPSVIIEIGSDQGYNTRNLLNFCRATGATLHAIDPLPKFDVAEWQEEYPDLFVFHRDISLRALQSISDADLVLIDGDHNWHTVFHELKTLEELAEDDSSRYPVVLLHDVGWPYGRRDLYYDPDRIPEPHRHPHRQAGLRPQRSDIDINGGLNRHLFNAVQEGGPQNGILTAIEDFLQETPLELEFLQVHGIHGLGILIPTELKSRNTDLAELLDEIVSGTVLQGLLKRVEALRVGSLIEGLDRKLDREEAEAVIARLKTQVESISNERDSRVAQLRERDAQLAALEEERDAQLAALEEERDAQLAALEEERDAQLAALEEERDAQLVALEEERDRQRAQTEIRLNSLRQERDHIAAQSRRLRGELKTSKRTLKSRDDRINQLATNIERLERDKSSVSNQLLRLKRRRAVRLALSLAGMMKPLIRTWRGARNRLTQLNLKRDTPQAAQTAQQVAHSSQIETPAQDSGVGSADIVVCIHNAEEDVRACLDSIVKTTNLVNHGLILVDDGSGESVKAMLEEFATRYPVNLIRNEQARGYTVAANLGIAASERPYVVLLNSDTVVGPGWLEKLIRCAEVMPDAAVVGPYSNAASWQSVPQLTNPDGSWHVNPLPEHFSPTDVAVEVEKWSPRLYPEIPLINGFCYLITRHALDQVGHLDEQSFPRGYGEEDDFSIRCSAAGLKLYVADDCYLYHAKSRSHTPEGRKAIVRDNKEILDRKHGAEAVRALVEHIQADEELVRSRTYVGAAIESAFREPFQPDLGDRKPLVGWLQPHLEQAGGIRRAIEMTNRLSRWGFHSVLIAPDGWKTDWLPVLADVVSIEEARSLQFDSLILSDPEMVWPFLELNADHRVLYHLAPYMLYRKNDETLKAYYELPHSEVHHVANSKWTAEQVDAYAGLSVDAIFPGGVDKRLFHPMRVERSYDVVCSGSPRQHKGTNTIEEACADLSLLKMHELNSSQHRLARLINSGQVYVSAAWHEGFNLVALEAMACGVPVVMTDDGGSREYAIDGENALLVEPRDATTLRQQILRLRDDSQLRVRLIENGLKTAWSYGWDSVTAEFASLLVGRSEDSAPAD